MASSSPAPYNRIRCIPELNTPRHIYQEWTTLHGLADISSTGSSVDFFDTTHGPPNVEELQVAVAQSCSLLDSMLHEAKPRCAKYRRKVESVLKNIRECVIFYIDIGRTATIRKALESSKQQKLEVCLKKLEEASSDVLVSLGQYDVHSEFLADPKLPHTEYWGILGEINEALFQNVQRYVERLLCVFEIVDFEAVAKELMQKGSEGEEAKPKKSYSQDIQMIEQELDSLESAAEKLSSADYVSDRNAVAIQTALATIDSSQDVITDMYNKFMELSNTAVQIYAGVTKREFTELYEKSGAYFRAAVKMSQSDDAYHLHSYIRSFLKRMRVCLRAFASLFSELEGAT